MSLTPVLVELTELKDWLGETTTDNDKILTRLLSTMEGSLNAACYRSAEVGNLFAQAKSGRIETHDGNGQNKLYCHYPVETLTTVEIGGNTADLEATLTGSDASQLRYRAGRRDIYRVDGGTFGRTFAPGRRRMGMESGLGNLVVQGTSPPGRFGIIPDPFAVRVTYDSGADLPEIARAALFEVVDVLFSLRPGSGDPGGMAFKSEKLTDYSYTRADLDKSITRSPTWTDAVKTCMRVP